MFHWACLNDLASRLPLHTAPAGYQCPTCQGAVFPPSNLASPVADVLKEQLSSVNWARAGLGLPLVMSCYCQDLCNSNKCTGIINNVDTWDLWQIEEPVGVLDETTTNSVSDYTDWSTFDGKHTL